MKQFIFEIKSRFGKNFPSILFGLLKLYFSKIKFENFEDERSNVKIDVVIPTTDKDFKLLSLVIESLKNVGNKINNIYIVAPANESLINFCKNNNIIFFDELKIFGFGKEAIKNYTVNGIDRRGWIFQQLLKYGMKDFVEQENYLVLDSDTILTNINTFIDENHKFVFFKNTVWHSPYLTVFKKMFGYDMMNYTSYTSHMMIMNKGFLNKMLSEIEQKNNEVWYKVIDRKIDRNEVSSISDYENYGQWMFIKHRDLMIEKPLYNISLNRDSLDSLENLEKKYHNKYKSISFHSYIK